MVTVHQAFGFRFVVFVNELDPPHVHVFGQGGEAKIDLLANGAAVLAWHVECPAWSSGGYWRRRAHITRPC